MANSDETKPIQSPKKNKTFLIVISILLGLGILLTAAYLLWLKPLLQAPLGEPLDMQEETTESNDVVTSQNQDAEIGEEVNPEVLCGNDAEWLVLVVGTDYREAEYLYGLADAIRIVRVDFTAPSINVVALPRALLIEDPGDRLDVEDPILLNQSYLFGTEGMGHFSGSGYGAGALADTLQTNFGLTFDHYLVLDFFAFKNFVYMIGGIQIDLPEAVYLNESEELFFPAGVQILDGEQALQFARARAYTSDNIRIDNQTLLLKAIFQRLQDPEVIKYLPQLMQSMETMILTDASLLDLQSAACLVNKLSAESITFFNPDSDLIEPGSVFIPTMDKEMDIFNWDQALMDWVSDSLILSPVP